MKPRHAVLVMLLCVAVAKGAAADKKSLPVSYFERKVDNAPAVGAAAEAVAASAAATQAARDKAGLQLFGSNDLGPHHEVVLNQTSRSYFRYGQEVGVRLPILGARSLQQQDIVQASAAEGIARLDFQAAHLQLVGRARSGYVAYWSARQQQRVAQGFMRQLAAQRSAAFALRKGGFWTSADALAYSGLREAAELDLSQARVDANNALRELSVVTAAPVGPFVPQEPPYATCALSPGRVVPTALATDVDLLKIAVQRAQATQLAALQRWVGYDANVNLGILSSIDAPGGLGYALLVGSSIALPTHVKSEREDELRLFASRVKEYDLLAEQRRAELTASIQTAIANRIEAENQLRRARSNERATAEALREAQVRMTYLAPNTLTDVLTRTQTAYQARRDASTALSAVLERTNDLLLLAPSACGNA